MNPQLAQLYIAARSKEGIVRVENGPNFLKYAALALPFILVACSPQTAENLAPEKIVDGFEPLLMLIKSWGNTLALGLIGAGLNGARAWGEMRSLGPEIAQYETALQEGRVAEGMAGAIANQLEAMRRRANPINMVGYVLKESGEGFITGAIAQVAWRALNNPETSILDQAVLLIATVMVGRQALKK